MMKCISWQLYIIADLTTGSIVRKVHVVYMEHRSLPDIVIFQENYEKAIDLDAAYLYCCKRSDGNQ